MQGAFVPYIHVVATAQSDGAVVGVEISGPADDPVVAFTSSPDLPDEEILARLLFGNNVENLSVLQAIELANAVRTLAGHGGEGMISKLRQNLGLDNLDLKTNAAGDSTLTVGKYLTRNVYSELSVDAKGQSEIHLNLDVSPTVTVRGTAASDGNSSLGVFVEKDY
jgi:translocation and assembly module TamB